MVDRDDDPYFFDPEGEKDAKAAKRERDEWLADQEWEPDLDED